MAIYRFRITFEDYDEVTKEIDILSKQTFLDLHRAIHASTGYPAEASSSFYVSNDQWKRGQEIAYLPSAKKAGKELIDMETAKLSRFIEDPHQKFYYTYNFDRPFDFHVQLIKILKEEEGKVYPVLFRSTGQVPKLPGTATLLVETSDQKEGDEFDFLNETQYGIDEAEDFDLLDEEEEENGEGAKDSNESESFEDNY